MDASTLVQQEIFGRFVLLEQLDAHGAETCRAIDLLRALQPIVTVRRLARWGSFTRRDHQAFAAAAALRARAHGELLAPHVDAGELEGVPWWATQYVPGLSLDRLLERALERGALSKGIALTICYCIAACLLDLTTERLDRAEHAAVAPLVHPRRFILAWSGRPIFLGVSYEQSAPDEEERRYAPPDYQGRVKAHADAFGLAGLLFELCTGLPFSSSVRVHDQGPLGAVPAELRRALERAIAMEHAGVRELMHVVEPLMKAAGGGHFSGVGRELGQLCGDIKAQEERTLAKEIALARRLQARKARVRDGATAPMKLSLRPASEEGPVDKDQAGNPHEAPQTPEKTPVLEMPKMSGVPDARDRDDL